MNAIANDAAEAVARGDATHEDLVAAIERALIEKSKGLPPKRVLYNGRRGSFGFSAEFDKFRESKGVVRTDAEEIAAKTIDGPSAKERTEAVDLVEEFGRDRAAAWPVAAKVLTLLASDDVYDMFWHARQFRWRVEDGSLREKKRCRRRCGKAVASIAARLGASEPSKLAEKLLGAPADDEVDEGRGRKGASATLQKLLEKHGEKSVEAWTDFARDRTESEMRFLAENADAFSAVEVDPLSVGAGFASGRKCVIRIARIPALVAVEIGECDGDEEVRWDGFCDRN